MRILNKYLLALVGVIALTLGACTDSVDYEGTAPVDGQGVYFPNTQASAITVDKASGDFVINVSRSKSEGVLDGDLSIKIDEADAGVFTIPSKVSFADGETDSKITVSYKDAVDGKKYTITLAATDGTVYANSTQVFTLTYVSPNSEVWEVVTDKGVFIDQMFSMFDESDKKFTEVKVEKAKGRNKYRIQSVYTNDYFEQIELPAVLPADFKLPYIILDGDSHTDQPAGGGVVAPQNARWYIAKTKLGFSVDAEYNLKYDTDWVTFGSVACNVSTDDGLIPPDSQTFPLGTYDEKKKMFDFGVCYHALTGYGVIPISTSKFQLYLDPNLMVPDFDRDYTWEDVIDATGYFNSEVVNEKWNQVVQQAKEDPTFYRFPSLYAENVAVYFNYDAKKGTLTMPKQQLTGLITYGNNVYVDAIANGTKVDKETNTFTFKLSLYLADKDGKKTHELLKATETFLWGQGPLDQLVKGKKIDDYVGAWKVPFTDLTSGKKVRKTELNLKGTPVQTNNTVKANSSIAPGTLMVR